MTIAVIIAELATIQNAINSLQSQLTQLAVNIAALPAPASGPTESPDGTSVTTPGVLIYASNTTGMAAPAGSVLDTWTINAAGKILRNGIVDPVTNAVTELVYSNHTVWQCTPANGASGLWWYWTGEVAGVGGAWVLDVAGPATGVVTPVTPVVAPVPVNSPAVPPAAAAAGFTKLVFNDDFTTTTTIAPNSSVQTGYNWYWNTQVAFGASNYSVNTSQTAASLNNGNNGGGNNASPAGGILHLIGVTGNSGNTGVLNTVPTNSTTGQMWQHAYFEAYIQTNAAQNNGSSANGWPGFWSWSTHPDPMTEIDFFEYWPPSGKNANAYGSLHEWPANVTASVSSNIANDSNWHTFGCLWTGNGTTGQVAWYYDNVLVGNPVKVGAGTNFPALETQFSYIALSAGNPWTLQCDWIRVWQAP
ncbi:unnamed protein product [Sphagnum tenellum]